MRRKKQDMSWCNIVEDDIKLITKNYQTTKDYKKKSLIIYYLI